MNTYTSYLLITRDIGQSLSRIEAQPMVSRETAYYRENIEKVKTIEEFVADDRLFRYAMKAHGLEDMAYAKAFMVKALKEGIDEEDSFANKLTDPRYKEFVKTFNFARYGEETTSFYSPTTGTVNKYLRQTLEEEAGRQNEGVRLALYFERKAKDIDSFYDVLADAALSKVVRTALGLPDLLAQADIDKQVELFKERIDIADFQDPEKLEDFLKRFTAMWEANNPGGAQNSIAALFTRPAAFGVSTDVLLSIAQMRK
ncbi:DUF1217 domain-containing protein [Chelativorans intermedius]|uniref:DUF1217 domain-containing protein n=1 Tax=Chelativorans intermedius TaxID=515947 RepID=A0ABV6D8Q2_9HYPH|nr:DUF1217 domain-containing protein [Chelativorans intermedius]MCT8997793.1 DUF1217 domain-containing protein [Chelativorans intermedius]